MIQFARIGSEPAEVKHLSKRRKREQMFIPLVAASEKGIAQTTFSRKRKSGVARK